MVADLRLLLVLFLTVNLTSGWLHEWKFNRLRRYRNRDHERKLERLYSEGVKDQWFSQKLCHSSHQCDGILWQQRYWQNDKYYKEDGLQFLYIGGEGGETSSTITYPELPMVNWAKKLGARLWNLEHRFYGKSQPTNDQSVENLEYLNSREALDDLANFITTKNNELNISNSKWILFGGSYPGALALWFRQKYPDLSIGAVGSSAPIDVMVDFFDYLRVCEDFYRSYSPKCAEDIGKGLELFREFLGSTKNRDQLDSAFGFVPPLAKQNLTYQNLQNVYLQIVGNFMSTVQYAHIDVENHPYGSSFIDVCNLMEMPFPNQLYKLIAVNYYLHKASGQTDPDKTYVGYEDAIDQLKNDSWNKDGTLSDTRSWIWQTCNEFGYFQTTGYDGIFGTTLPVNYYIIQCSDIFGEKFTRDYVQKKIQDTVDYYGRARDYNGTNVVIPNGSLDPWHALGVYTSKDSSAISILINGTSHCADMLPPKENDPQSLKDARKLIFEKLQEWIANGTTKETEVKQEVKLTARRAPEFMTKICWDCQMPETKMKNRASRELTEKMSNQFINGRHVTGGFLRVDLLKKKYSKQKRNNPIKSGYIEQKLDHFDQNDTRRFKQVFYYNNQYFNLTEVNPVVFLYNPGEGGASQQDLDVWWAKSVWAKKFGAAMFSLEHRFYGKSQPFDTMTVENLQYLTSEQALGDVATFIRNVNAEKGWKNARWILFGGAMVAWTRSVYPDITFAAIGSSGPVEAKVDFYGYLQTVESSLRAYDDECGDALAKAFNTVHNLSLTIEGRKKLDAAFSFTGPFGDAEYVEEFRLMYFYLWFIAPLEDAVQYTYQFESIKLICNVFMNSTLNDLEKLAKLTSKQKLAYGMQDYVEFARSDSNGRAWSWQTYNEFGWYQTTDGGSKNAFGSTFTINVYMKELRRAFDSNFTRDQLEDRIDVTNQRYGGARDYKATRSIQVYGTLDPWHTIGIHESDNLHDEDVIIILINGTSHCADMYEPRETDIPDLVKARETITNYLTKWLS
ncbi:Peptidase S28 family-containing protein [Aphelenchoides besseyi]|nr:Peptidase S28 family-containing protein [Aphelenchoides besseyi]